MVFNSRHSLRTKWFMVPLFAAMVASITFAFVYLALVLYLLVHRTLTLNAQVPAARLEQVYSISSGWGAWLIFLIAVTVASYMAALGLREPIRRGLSVGLLSAAVVQSVVALYFPPLFFTELITFSFFGPLGGLLGGLWARRAMLLHQRLEKTNAKLKTASGPQEIVSTMGVELKLPAVFLWRLNGRRTPASEGGDDILMESYDLAAVCPTNTLASVPQDGELRLETSFVGAFDPSAQAPFIEISRIPQPLRSRCEARGFRGLLLFPMIGHADEYVGLMAVPKRRWTPLARRLQRDCRVLASQAALTLQILDHVERAEVRGRSRERQRWEIETHDTVVQSLAGAKAHLEAAAMHTDPDAFGPRGEARQFLQIAIRLTSEGYVQARRMIHDPDFIDDGDLPDVLADLAAKWSADTNIELTTAVTGEPYDIASDITTAVSRVTQEALTNVRKHARAGRVALTLSYMDDLLVLDILDDGRGFDPDQAIKDAAPGHGRGLLGMRRRAEQLGGTLRLESAPGNGTALALQLPIRRSHADDDRTTNRKETP